MKRSLFTPMKLGADLELPNRIIMAPLTRMRAGAGLVPQPMAAVYYSQRASAGLIITEATDVSRQAHGYASAPGIYTDAQIRGWRTVTDAVHKAGGRIFVQLWHTGRVSHPSMQEHGQLPVAPTAIAAEGFAQTYDGPQPLVVPRALETEEVPDIVEQFRQASINALDAGFDGVEIHSANGYLLDQFLHDGSNQRTDKYGGSIQNRARLLLEVVDAVVGIWGAGRVGVRLSPSGTYKNMHDSNPLALYTYVASRLNEMNIAYIHIVEPRVNGSQDIDGDPQGVSSKELRPYFANAIISAGGYTRQLALDAIEDGTVNLIAFGRLFISNPDLPRRLALNAPLNAYDRSTFYGGNEHGYTDYPTLEQVGFVAQI